MSFPALIEEARQLAYGTDIPFAIHQAADREFEAELDRVIPAAAAAKAFYSKIAGVTHVNADGSSRIQLVKELMPFEALELRREPKNPVDPNAVAVHFHRTGQQLGYLPAHTAPEVQLDMLQGGTWVGFVRRRYREPHHDRTVGAIIFVVRVAEGFSVTLK